MYKKELIENIYDHFPLFDLNVFKKKNNDLKFDKDEEYLIYFNNIGYKQNRVYHNNIYHIYNKYHLGDNIFNMIFFNKILKYLKENNYKVYYYCLEQYHKQVEEFIEDKNYIILKKIDLNNLIGLEAWINNENLIKKYELQNKIGFDRYYMYFFNLLSKRMNIPYYFHDLKYIDNDLLIRQNKLEKNNYQILNNLDILIINSEPLSGQYNYNRENWKKFIFYLSNKFKIITTLKIDNIPCTMDYNFSCKDIAAISTKVNYIISINTGPFVGCYNEYTLEHVKKIYIFVDNLTFEHYKISVHKDINDLYEYF